ncbi:SigE family RNA polymerase sigma factor [Micromonospora sp. WMMD1082]|uniref:SigE family RNA polymerase sigma factor n=1 Tax=Micromonospora sp. WMMD1082 TaxID=3016104 RepID=UPI002415BBC7|nr:SigE family RNA polymerase sigma factor [Micromonospora sp. WMMD1082]MDG4794869.1 SigE family RNA polymerase sigma factor [Micromonospora sp. WMMD1082]
MRDAEGFDEFYRGTSGRLLRYGYALTGDLAEAQDIVQEAYVRAWQRWRKLASYDSTESWVRLVVARLATDRWRRMRSQRVALRRAGPPDHVAAPSDDTVLLVGALRRLPPVQRQAIALYYLCDMSVAEIAAETDAPPGTVKSWLSRGRAGLAAVLDDLTPEAHDVG